MLSDPNGDIADVLRFSVLFKRLERGYSNLGRSDDADNNEIIFYRAMYIALNEREL